MQSRGFCVPPLSSHTFCRPINAYRKVEKYLKYTHLGCCDEKNSGRRICVAAGSTLLSHRAVQQ